MGYTTDFEGSFIIDKTVDEETAKLLKGLANTRRMKRNVQGFGVEGEFYVDGKRFARQGEEDNILNYNAPPKTQPSLWCHWLLQDDNKTIEWDGGEKFYEYIEWMEYLIKTILKPRGYSVSGEVKWFGQEREDAGIINVNKNRIQIRHAHVIYK
jgi:hypothetical protein